MRLFDHLVKQLQEMGYRLPNDLRLRRTHAGYWQRTAGAWSWYAVDDNGRERVAGYIPVRELAGKRLSCHGTYPIEVDALTEENKTERILGGGEGWGEPFTEEET